MQLGIVAVRDSDYSGMTWYPASAGLEEWSALYHEVTQANGSEADAGRLTDGEEFFTELEREEQELPDRTRRTA